MGIYRLFFIYFIHLSIGIFLSQLLLTKYLQMTKINNQKLHVNLSNCDLINKYIFCQSEKCLLTKVILRLTSVDILKAIEKSNQNDSNSETNDFFLIIYIQIISTNNITVKLYKNKGIEKIFYYKFSHNKKRNL
jgi:hypothetical protein